MNRSDEGHGEQDVAESPLSQVLPQLLCLFLLEEVVTLGGDHDCCQHVDDGRDQQ
jgi:hypothetical protein